MYLCEQNLMFVEQEGSHNIFKDTKLRSVWVLTRYMGAMCLYCRYI